MSKRVRLMHLRLLDILISSDAEAVELLMSVFLLMWCGWLLLPYETFASMTTYRAINDVIDERWVGVVGCAVALVRIYCILTLRYRPLRYIAVLVGAFWGYNLALGMIANPATLLVPVYAGLLLASIWVSYWLQRRSHAS